MNVPTSVIQDLELVRQGGKYNMLDCDGVLKELFDLGKYQTVVWLVNYPTPKSGGFLASSFMKEDTDSHYVRADRKKYVEALKVLGDTIHLANKLASE